jgi:hypothetical protein
MQLIASTLRKQSFLLVVGEDHQAFRKEGPPLGFE